LDRIFAAPNPTLKPREILMTTPHAPTLRPLWTVLLPIAFLGATSALAADATVQDRYQRDIAACKVAPEGTDKSACMREAGAARASKDLGGNGLDPETYSRNALKRCEPLPEPFRSDCVARSQGGGSTSGSVSEGGVLRELVTPGSVAPITPPTR
jgi:hypothetical protein